MAFTCDSEDQVDACPLPEPGSDAYLYVQRAIDEADFEVQYPCYLPNSQRLRSSAITGEPDRQLVEFAWDGPFDMTIRQAQFAPAPVAATVGASRRTIDLFPNTRATFIEINDGSAKAQYHLLWNRNGIYYELQAVGPPLQQDTVLRIARSLQPVSLSEDGAQQNP
jgi:hypothetical protein